MLEKKERASEWRGCHGSDLPSILISIAKRTLYIASCQNCSRPLGCMGQHWKGVARIEMGVKHTYIPFATYTYNCYSIKIAFAYIGSTPAFPIVVPYHQTCSTFECDNQKVLSSGSVHAFTRVRVILRSIWAFLIEGNDGTCRHSNNQHHQACISIYRGPIIQTPVFIPPAYI